MPEETPGSEKNDAANAAHGPSVSRDEQTYNRYKHPLTPSSEDLLAPDPQTPILTDPRKQRAAEDESDPDDTPVRLAAVAKRHVRRSEDTAALMKVTSVPTSPLALVPYRRHTTLAPERERLRLRRKFLQHLSRKRLRQARASDHRTMRRFWIMLTSAILSLLIVFLSMGAAGGFVAYRFFTQTQAQYNQQVLTLHDLLPLDNLKIYDSKGVLLAQMTDQGLHTTVTFDQIALSLQQATVATEDKYFWTNEGIDVLRILRAALDDLEHGHVVEGGSTITQQLIKNLIVGPEPTIVRKLEEIVLAPQLNDHYTKSDILTMYLNTIYYGHQAYGIDAAATTYFGLEDRPGAMAAQQLDIAQAAMLAGIPSSPSLYDPLSSDPGVRQVAFERFNTVLDLMVNQRYITRAQELDALSEAQGAHFFKSPGNLLSRAPHFTNFVLDELRKDLHMSLQQLSRSGLSISTTLDISLQDKIQKIAQRHVAELKANNVSNAAEVLIDYHTGAIISLLGSIDYYNSSIDGQFDVATQGYRQPGSSFKPYVYVTAFEQGASPAQAIDDAPLSIPTPGSPDPVFSPKNYDRLYHGHMTLRCALQNSLNVPAVKVLQHVGINAAMQTAEDMGINSYQGTPGYSLVLGGLGVLLIDHTSAIGTFANGGVHVDYYAINKVVASGGQVLYQHQKDPGLVAISPQLAYMMTNVLSDNGSRTPEFFDCNVLQLYANSQQSCFEGDRGPVRPAAVKTGTTEDFRDNWTVGYTTDYVMGVWVGNDNNKPMTNVTGVQGAAPIWHDSMLQAEKGHPIRNFTNPGGLVQATITYPDGVRSTDLFLPGTVPPSAPVPAATPTPDTTTGPTPSPTPVSVSTSDAQALPYCPSSYSFAFQPPAANAANTGWW